jgi:hypothetical protein
MYYLLNRSVYSPAVMPITRRKVLPIEPTERKPHISDLLESHRGAVDHLLRSLNAQPVGELTGGASWFRERKRERSGGRTCQSALQAFQQPSDGEFWVVVEGRYGRDHDGSHTTERQRVLQ